MGIDYDILRNQILEIMGRVDTGSTHRFGILSGIRIMPAIICPARVAVAPRPFLLEDHFQLLGQLCVVRDEDWDKVAELMKHEANVAIETDRGPFLIAWVNPLKTAEVQDEKTEL